MSLPPSFGGRPGFRYHAGPASQSFHGRLARIHTTQKIRGIVRKTVQRIKTDLQTHPSYWLIVAACLHLAATITIFIIGKFSLMPSQFDGNGVGDFAADGRMHQLDALTLTERLGSHGIGAWLSAAAPLHVRIYSLSQVLLSRWIGFNILAVEPINLFFYLAILVIVYKLAEAMFDRRAAFLAAAIVGLWPTLLLHTTQPLRDPLLIALVTILFLILTRLLTHVFSWRQTIIASLGGAVVLLAVWVVRLSMWDIVRAIVGMTTVFVLLRLVRERRLMIGNIITVAVFILAIWIIPQGNKLLQFTEKRQVDVSSGRVLIGEKVIDMSLWARITARRNGFIDRQVTKDYNAGSDIDTDVRFHNQGELVRYLPRAAAIGLFAPFPNMWIAPGNLVGRTGRWLSGFEMLLTYLIEALAVYGLWRKRRELAAWLLTFSALLGVTALGLIVINIGSLYRLRYAFWVLIVIMGAGGLMGLLSDKFKKDSESVLVR
jgi:hypothetical protein